jgi:protein TonB
MTGTALVLFQSSRYAGAAGRFRLALATSTLFHLLFAAGLLSETPQHGTQDIGLVPLSVRIEHQPVQSPANANTIAGERPSRPHPARRDATVSQDLRHEVLHGVVSGTMQETVHTPAVPQAPDLTVYMARDLDSYPRPVVPLDVGRFADRSAGIPPGGVSLELTIDEHGIVSQVAYAGPGTAGALETGLRAMLAATRFFPALKDGRAVKSRVILSINSEINDR